MMFAEFLVNEDLPEKYKFHGTITKKALTERLTQIAKESPELYPAIVKNIKKVGDFFATYEGVSVGLDDITPDYKARDKIVDSARKDLLKIKDPGKITDRLLQAQAEGLHSIKTQNSSLRRQVESGSRGSPGQLLKSVFSPIVAKGHNDLPQPYLITKSYAEGLTPGEFWLTAGESRRELAQVQLATAIPGDTSKIINSTLQGVLVTKPDCGTTNGIELDRDDPQVIDRYEAGSNKLIDGSYWRALKAKNIKHIRVRSPLTCLEHPGCCQKCYGLSQHGQLHTIGTNIGLRAAQSLSEPLTQMVLSAKHGGHMAKADKPELRGTLGFRQLIGIPEIFKHEATLSQKKGTVTKITPSPQGGTEIFVGDHKHYLPPKRKVEVKVGQSVLPGQHLSDGIANPEHIVSLQGLGQGRKYMLDTIYNIYKDSGVDIDKRLVETLVKQDLNHVRVTEPDDQGLFVKGDIVPYNHVREHLEAHGADVKVKDAIGQRLGKEYLHYVAGTPVTHELAQDLHEKGFKTIFTTAQKLSYEPIMKSIEQIPLLSKDWLSRLGHRRIKDTLLQGAAEGWETDTRANTPLPSLVYGTTDFGKNIGKAHY